MPNPARLSKNELSSDSLSMSSQSPTSDDPIISSQMAASSQMTESETQVEFKRPCFSSTRKRKATSALIPEQTFLPATLKQTLPSPKRSLSNHYIGRLLQLRAGDTIGVYKMNEERLADTSDLFKYKLFHETHLTDDLTNKDEQDYQKSDSGTPSSQQSTSLASTVSSTTTVDPRYPIVVLNVSPRALFLYCLWKLSSGELYLYIDSTIPRPSTDFVIYLYQAFNLAIELKDSVFLTELVNFIVKDSAGRPSEYAISWAYENTDPNSMLRDFVVDCTLTWADEEMEEWRKVASGVPKEFLADVTCRLMELGMGRKFGLAKADVADRFTFSMGWPVEGLGQAAEAVGTDSNDSRVGSSAQYCEGRRS